jgi:hypothetical protein
VRPRKRWGGGPERERMREGERRRESERWGGRGGERERERERSFIDNHKVTVKVGKHDALSGAAARERER